MEKYQPFGEKRHRAGEKKNHVEAGKDEKNDVEVGDTEAAHAHRYGASPRHRLGLVRSAVTQHQFRRQNS